MPKKYKNAALWRCLRLYPQERHFKMFVGRCYAMTFTRANLMDRILQDYFKQFTDSEQELLLKKYDEYFLLHTIRSWPDLREGKLSHETVHFLYSKIKYRKVMCLNIGFNEQEYKWSLMWLVFDSMFKGGTVEDLKELIKEFNEELQKNILAFALEVKMLKEAKA